MDTIEKVIAPVVVFLTWLGSFEWRLRNKVSKDLFNQHKKDNEERLNRGNTRFSKNDELLTKFADIQIEQGKTLVKIHTIVERMDKNGIK